MDSCSLSSTGLHDIDANEITADNIYIYSDLNVSGRSTFNELIVNDNITLLSSLNVEGVTTLNNDTILLSSLNVSGLTTLQNETNVNAMLYVSGVNVFETLNAFDTVLSTLSMFRSDNDDALVTYNIDTSSTEIHSYGGEIIFDTTQTMCSTKIDSDGQLNVYHEYDALLPVHLARYWIVHDEIASILQQDIINTANSLIQQVEITKVAAATASTAALVATLILVLGVGSIISTLLGGGGGSEDPPPSVDVVGINIMMNENKNNINSLSSSSTLSINALNSTTTRILGYIDNLTSYSVLNTTNLNVSGMTILKGNSTLLSSLNVSGLTTLNNATILSTLNVSGLTILNNNTSIFGTFNVSGFTTLMNTTITSSLNVSGLTTLNNNTTILSRLNVSGLTTLNNATILSTLNVSGLTVLNNNTSIFGTFNVSGFTTLKNTTILSSLNVSGSTTLNNATILSTLNVSGFTILNNATITSSFNVSGLTILNNMVSLCSSLNVSGFTILNNNTSIVGTLNVSGLTTLTNTTITSSLNVSGLTTLNNTTILSSLNVSGFTTLSNNASVKGVLSVSNGSLYGVSNGCMAKGSLNIGDINSDYGNGNGWTGSTAGILMECYNNTEIAVHDNLKRVASLIAYQGENVNTIKIGRNMGWGVSNLTIEGSNTTILSSLNVSGSTTLNNTTIMSSLNVSGLTTLGNNATLLSSLNVSGFTTLNNATILSTLNVSGLTILNNNTTILSSLNVSGLTTLNNATITSSLNVSGLTILNNNTTIISSLNVSGLTTLGNNATMLSSLNVSGFTTLGNNATLLSSLNVSGLTILNNATILSTLNVSGLTILNNNTSIFGTFNVSGLTTLNKTTITSTLNVSGLTQLNNNVTLLSSLNVSGLTTLSNTTIISSLNVSGLTTLSNNTTLLSSLNVSGISIFNNNVGIGLNPSYKLHVTAGKTVNSTAFAMKISGGAVIDSGNYGTLLGLGSEDAVFSKCAIGHVRTGPYDQGDIVFLTRPTQDAVSCDMTNERMRIKSNGSVGMGTTAPNGGLHIERSYTATTPDLNNHIYCYNPSNAINSYCSVCMRTNNVVGGRSFMSYDVNQSHGWSVGVKGNDATNKGLYFNNNWAFQGSDVLTLLSNGNVEIKGATTVNGTLNVSGLTTLLNNTNIRGILSVDNGNQYAIPNGRMQKGSLSIGDTLLNYGNQFYETLPTYDGPNWTTNTSGLLMECIDNTEIAVHRNSNNKVSSLLCYVGGATNTIILGRDMGWGSSSLDIKGKTTIGFNPIPLSDAIFEVYNNISIRKNRLNFNNVNVGDYAYISAGTGMSKCSLSLEDGNDANITSLKGVIGLNASNTQVSGDLYVNGRLINGSISQIVSYISAKVPVSFITSRTVSINSVNYSAYDVNLNTYTKYILLDGRKIRQFRLRSWHASGDFENYSAEIAVSYHIFMSDLNGLSIKAFSAPYLNLELDQLNGSTPSFYRNNFDTLTYLAPSSIYGSNVKVYCIFEDLL